MPTYINPLVGRLLFVSKVLSHLVAVIVNKYKDQGVRELHHAVTFYIIINFAAVTTLVYNPIHLKFHVLTVRIKCKSSCL